jgi:prepilin peptidase CpaA
MTQIHIVYAVMLAITLIACVTDLRTGLIPNWLTLPALIAGPLLWAARSGLSGLGASSIGIVVAGLVPLVFWRLGGMGGGDVKLFAALGGLAGPKLGLEVELLALACAFVWGLVRLAYDGRLLRALGNSGRIMLNPFLPSKHRRQVDSEQLTTMRIGAAIFIGTLIAVIDHTFLGGLLS